MSTVKFIVLNHEKDEFDFSVENTVNDLRLELAKKYYNSSNYVDINCVMKTPIRVFGKLTLEPGKIPPSYNDSRFDRFGIGGREIHINIEELQKKNETKTLGGNWGKGSKGVYVPIGNRSRKEQPKDYVYNESDFPALGS